MKLKRDTLTYYVHDDEPSHEDGLQRALRYLNVAAALHSPLPCCTGERSPGDGRADA